MSAPVCQPLLLAAVHQSVGDTKSETLKKDSERDPAIAIHNAQTIRQGYTSFRRSLNSMAMLGAMLFIRAWKEAEDLIIAMDCRCYDGKLELPGHQNPPKPAAIASTAMYLGLCITVAIITSTIVPFR